MFWGEVKNDAMTGIPEEFLAGGHGLVNPTLTFDAEVALKTDRVGN